MLQNNMTELNYRQIAKICHEANRAYCEEIGDTSQNSWPNATAWQQVSATEGVKFFLAFTNASPEQLHENWVRDKEKSGWKYGPKKNARLKTHPCILPYDKLSDDDRRKDKLFQAIVRALS